MIVLQNYTLSCFDVDNTLIHKLDKLEDLKAGETGLDIQSPYTGDIEEYKMNPAHIKLLKHHKARGNGIIVWSHDGYKWAETVINILQLEKYVDLCMTKPHLVIDDIHPTNWGWINLYLKNGWGK